MTGMQSKSNKYIINFCKPNRIVLFDIPTILRHLKELPWISPLHISPDCYASSSAATKSSCHSVTQWGSENLNKWQVPWTVWQKARAAQQEHSVKQTKAILTIHRTSFQGVRIALHIRTSTQLNAFTNLTNV